MIIDNHIISDAWADKRIIYVKDLGVIPRGFEVLFDYLNLLSDSQKGLDEYLAPF